VKVSAARSPTRRDLEAARGARVPDLIRPGLSVLLCGINPSLYSAAVGHHFARPGNRFWLTLFRAGYTDRLLRPDEEGELLERGVGITNIVAHATRSAAELTRDDYRMGGLALARKVRRYRPRIVAFVGIEAYRIAARKPLAKVGPQPERFAGAEAWVLPNPSGINAHYQIDDLIAVYRKLARRSARTR
jgi:TDG/mug DNA glycosylase family protein